MVKRSLTEKVRKLAEKFPVISISGPRQSGKTTLARACFPEYDYVNLELPDIRSMAYEDPREFLNTYRKGLILDEVQNVPEIFSYLQVFADESKQPGKYILTGSQNFLLLEKISQSLAGRAAILTLLPFSLEEITETGFKSHSHADYLFKGSYPAVFDKEIEPTDFYPSYIQSYLERDVRSIINIGNVLNFRKFLGIIAGRTGQIINYTSIANDTGVDQKTIQRWLSVLEASYIVFLLRPFHKNFSKRLIKSPKLYFYDTGLACSLLGIKKADDTGFHFLKGALFENLVISEIAKHYFHRGIRPDLYFWRDNTGNEVDCLIEEGLRTKAIEIKAGTTIGEDFFNGLKYYQKISGIPVNELFLVYGGVQSQKRSQAKVVSWIQLDDLY
jgi:predicted AAA+ superfamily ATPase